MSVYLISYDLGSPETSADYEKLIDHIKSFEDWCKPEYSLWLIRTGKSVSTVRDELKELVDGNDRILVVNVTNSTWTSYQLPGKVTEWMKTNM